MNRRNFIAGLLGTATALTIPFNIGIKKWWEDGYRGPLSAEQFLTKAWNNHTKGTSYCPTNMEACPALFDSFKSNVTALQRWTPETHPREYSGFKTLVFKSTKLYRASGWWAPSLWHVRVWDDKRETVYWSFV